MIKGIQWFMERLAERIVPIVGSSFASTLETMHALGQAEQQDQLEEAARRYEAEGKPELASRLRERAQRITSGTPGEQGVAVFEAFGRDQQRMLPPSDADSSDNARIGSASTPKKKSRQRRTIPAPDSDAE
ncbi:MAG: hypothetical protein ACYTGL_30180 [Planctomycetota bacterium]|jgi:hypothetical protein